MSLWVPPKYRFVDHGNAQEVHASLLHDVQIIGDEVRFIPVTVRVEDGEMIGVPQWIATLPLGAAGPAALLTLKILAAAMIPEGLVKLAEGMRLH